MRKIAKKKVSSSEIKELSLEELQQVNISGGGGDDTQRNTQNNDDERNTQNNNDEKNAIFSSPLLMMDEI
jgi:hypothetical protein